MSALECRVAKNGHADISVYDIDKPVKENGTDERYVLFDDSNALSDEQRRSVTRAIHGLRYPSDETKAVAVTALANAGRDTQSARGLVDKICETVKGLKQTK